MKFGKRGTASEMWAPGKIIFWIIFDIMLGLTAVFFIIIVSKFGSGQATIQKNVESLNLMQRFFKSPGCFVYDKENLMRVIDADKFNEQQLNNCYIINNNGMPAFKLNLKSEKAGVDKTAKTSNWNDNIGYEERKAPQNMLVYSNGKLYNGELIIEMQNIR